MATGAGGSWSHLHASGYARVHNGHNFNNNYYFNGSPTQFYAPEDEQTGEKLLKAAREGHTPRVEALLRDRPDLRDYADAKELTALHYAFECGHEHTLRAIWRHGADINAYSRFYGTPLCLAAFQGYENIVESLLRRRADLKANGGLLGSALHAACWSGNAAVVTRLLDLGVSPRTRAIVSFEDMSHMLHPVSELTGEEHVLYTECEPLWVAARCNDIDIVELLMKRRVHVDATARQWDDTLSVEARFEDAQPTQSGSGLTALMEAASRDLIDTLEQLLYYGANPDLQTSHGNTALISAITSRAFDSVSTLLRNKVSLDLQTNEGMTAAMFAADRDCLPILRQLVQAGASIDIVANNGYTAFDFAIRSEFGRKCRQFLQPMAPDARSEATSTTAGPSVGLTASNSIKCNGTERERSAQSSAPEFNSKPKPKRFNFLSTLSGPKLTYEEYMQKRELDALPRSAKS